MGNKGSKTDRTEDFVQLEEIKIKGDSGEDIPSIKISEISAELELIDKLRTLKENFNPAIDCGPAGIASICAKTSKCLLQEPSLLRLEGPIVVAGDIHGQFRDLRKIFARFGWPPSTKYLFLGDYVDRGDKGIEVCLLLFALKCVYPESIFLLRGNHECARVNRDYGFLNECRKKMGMASYSRVYDSFGKVFNSLPIAATIGDSVFCVHGGISPHLQSLDQISCFKRPNEIPDFGLIYDLLWSDPAEASEHVDQDGWGQGSRGLAQIYGDAAVNEMMERFEFELVCRSHGFAQEGYRFHADNRVLTIFSAPNYCSNGNAGAVLHLDHDMRAKIHLFN